MRGREETTPAHIESTNSPGVALIMAAASSGKSLLDQIEERGMGRSRSDGGARRAQSGDASSASYAAI